MATQSTLDSHFSTTSKKDSEQIKTKESKLVYSEVQGDLFKCPPSSSLAHCVSEDLHMGKGIATIFKKEFGHVGELKAQGVGIGGVAVLSNKERYIYYLVTKARYYHKPTYESLTASLRSMKTHIVSHGINELSMPLLGCGLDQLKWDKVKKIIHELFNDIPITITVYYLK